MISIELFFLVNALLDAQLLILAMALLDVGPARFTRTALAAALGGIYACAAMAYYHSPLRTAAIALPAACLMARVITPSQTIRVTLKAAGFFLTAAMLTGGAAYGIITLMPSIHPMAAVTLACAVSAIAGRAFVGSRRRTRLEYGRVHVKYREAQWDFDAAVDTGNQAVDPVTTLPIMVMRGEDARRFYPMLDDLPMDAAALPQGMRLISVRTVSGTALLPCFTPEVITWNEQQIHAAIAVAPRGLIRVALAPSCITRGLMTSCGSGRKLA